MVDTGIIDAQPGRIYSQYGDHIPFFRQWDNTANTSEDALIATLLSGVERERPGVPQTMFNSLTGAKAPRKAVEGDEPILDPFASILQNSLAALSSGMKNVAAQRTIRDAELLGLAIRVEDGEDVYREDYPVTIRVKGKELQFKIIDPLLHSTLEGFAEGELPYLKAVALPATILREMVTRSPDFILANLLRDPVSAWPTSGSSFIPIISTFKHMLDPQGKGSPSFEALDSAGLNMGYDFARDLKSARDVVLKKYKKEGVNVDGKNAFWNPFTMLWDYAGDVTGKSDMATRQAVYEDVLKRLTPKYGRDVAEAEAIHQAQEIINFSRRGGSKFIRYVTAMFPFTNARIQGLSVLYRAARGKYSSDAGKVAANRAFISFAARMGTLTALSSAYWFMVHDEDEYKNAKPEVRQDNIILPRFGGMLPSFVPNKIPKPFEVGLLGITVPEIILELMFGDGEWRSATEAIKRSLQVTLQMSPIPQFAKPAWEAYTNRSSFTQREIVSKFQEGAYPSEQYNAHTNTVAMLIGDMFNVSPAKVEHVLRGYGGTVGSYALFLTDAAVRPLTDYPVRPDMKFEKYPMFRRFYQPAQGGGELAALYDFREVTERLVNTVSKLRTEGRYLEANEMEVKNIEMVRAASRMRGMDKVVSNLRREKMRVMFSRHMTGEEKADVLENIDERIQGVLWDIREVRKRANLPSEWPFPLSVLNT